MGSCRIRRRLVEQNLRGCFRTNSLWCFVGHVIARVSAVIFRQTVVDQQFGHQLAAAQRRAAVRGFWPWLWCWAKAATLHNGAVEQALC